MFLKFNPSVIVDIIDGFHLQYQMTSNCKINQTFIP